MRGAKRPATDEVQFTVTYDGPDLTAGRMDAAVLGAAMVEMAGLIDAAAGLTLGAGRKVNVEVTADFKQGSFSYEVIALTDIAKNLIDSTDMATLLTMLGVTGSGGLIGFVAWMRNRKVKSVTPESGSRVKVATEDGDATIIHAHTVNLFQNSKVRAHLEGVVRPLEKEGITEFRAGTGRKPAVVVRQEEIEYFEAPVPEGQTLQDRTQEEIVQIVSVTFQAGRKWKFALADGTSFFSHVDDEFAERVMRHDVAFGAGDALKVQLHSRVLRDATGGLSAARDIIRVLEHLPAPTQFRLGPGGMADEE